jgi:hypothetical protein
MIHARSLRRLKYADVRDDACSEEKIKSVGHGLP